MATVAFARPQSQDSGGTAVVRGYVHGSVHDVSGKPVANAVVLLLSAARDQSTHTDSEGRYRFEALPAGLCSLRVKMTGYDGATSALMNFAQHGTTVVNFTLLPTQASKLPGAPPAAPATSKPSAQAPEFYDEPQFTVAGVTQASNYGGHGTDAVVRTTEALARATLSLSSLSKEPDHVPQSAAATENSLREALTRNPGDAALHHQLGDVEEKLGHPLEAVRQYQRASELEPSEQYLFDWGTELLTHRALQPAAEVFTRGNRLFPKSVRMLVALGVAEYALGSYDRAALYLGSASDLDSGNETPYLFMGKMQGAETAPSQETLERLARFQHLEPGNALANYYYAVSLWRGTQWAGARNDATSEQVEALLQKAIQIDPKLGAAHLQLGILYAERGDYAHAISAYRQAIEVSPELEEAHYRLAQAYRRTGDDADAQKELRIHEQLAKEAKAEAERERKEIQQFVISLGDDKSTSK